MNNNLSYCKSIGCSSYSHFNSITRIALPVATISSTEGIYCWSCLWSFGGFFIFIAGKVWLIVHTCVTNWLMGNDCSILFPELFISIALKKSTDCWWKFGESINMLITNCQITYSISIIHFNSNNRPTDKPCTGVN